MLKHILVPVDGSDFSNHALKYAAKIAEKFDSEITLVTVTQPVVSYLSAVEGLTLAANEFEARLSENAASLLAKAAASLKSLTPCNPNEVYLPNHHEGDGIVKVAKDKGCDGIIMASHGRRGLSKLLIGSTAQEVITRADIPVLIVKGAMAD